MPSEAKDLEREEQGLQRDLDELLADSIRKEWPRNAAIWLGVVIGSFAVIIVVLVVVTGG
jgi:hypothetical protein